MKELLHHRFLYVSIAVVIIAIVVSMMLGFGQSDKTPLVTTTVEAGKVRQVVSVSGIAKAKQTAELAFPTGGIIESVSVKVGDTVKAGDTLITLDNRALQADRQEAAAAVAQATAARDELLKGPTDSNREVTSETLLLKQSALKTIKENETQKVANAFRTLLSSDLTAYSGDDKEDAVPPTISGTYNCTDEGKYFLETYSSNAKSGFSYKISGLETGTYVASVDQPISIGKCGLLIKFDSASNYNRTKWEIEIPNTKSASYVTNRNAYTLATVQAESAIAQAEQEVALAKASATNQNAPARSEAIARANSAIAQAHAKLARVNSTLADRTLKAPFAGTITEIDILPGETVNTAPVVTLLADSFFEVTARIPEIDIGKLLIGQKVEMVFDARSNETLTGEIRFISLKAIEIDGVSYYEAFINIDELPQWIRSGLNADIDIIILEQETNQRIPKRFIKEINGKHEVLVLENGITSTSTIEIEMEGNDGYVAITGLDTGDIIVAP